MSNLDMDNFEKNIKAKMKKVAFNASLDITCPKCGTKFKGRVGQNKCPNCSVTIEIKPDSSWDKL
ncbi:hypothetical protein [Pediococcus claussenii]|uniref:hypothetical protein n=1 Tax=Pediococcus claussenii TaxID=187452 RepID=UPI00081A632C|nr:hypothetical protein [Pediococcus claussenii]ANZ70345.1 hypothetical protein AYR57_08465 [Pediococcus claussenii]ANZ72161.1 hypothetical protein AYR58_08465 [Pediococcus claussenii]